MVNISLKNNSPREQETKRILKRILEKYPLDKWILCNEVLIEHGIVSHSWPIVTINTKCEDEYCLLAKFLHEQIHWIEEKNPGNFAKALEELKTIYRTVPVGEPEGAKDEKSSYRHLIVCRLEFGALKELIGEEKAKEVVLTNKHYAWIRKKAIEEGDKIDAVIQKFGLIF